jgi:hypothetical protein
MAPAVLVGILFGTFWNFRNLLLQTGHNVVLPDPFGFVRMIPRDQPSRRFRRKHSHDHNWHGVPVEQVLRHPSGGQMAAV